jgi:SAM-dependent methyltransferase
MRGDGLSPRDLYDATAASWVRTEPLSLSDFTGRPATLAMCQPVSDLRVLDLGCGEGYCARQLARSGARDVTGVDVSAQMIHEARRQEEAEPLGIQYRVADATCLGELSTGDYDLVVAMFLFNYLLIAETRACMAEVARILRPGGRFVFAVPHPAFPYLASAGPPFFFEVGLAGYFNGRDGRFPGKIWKRDGRHLEVQVCHKTIEDYFSALGAAGFSGMPMVKELRVTPEILAVDPAFFRPLLELPLHLAVAVTR